MRSAGGTWRDRFRATMTIHAVVAEDEHDRGVVVSNKDGALQAYSWDRPSERLVPVTDGDAATLEAAISSDGEWLYHLVEDLPGSEIGHIHRVPFDGGESEDLTPDLPPYSPFGLVSVGPYIAFYAGIDGGVEAMVIRDGEVSRHLIDGLPLGVVIDPARGWLVLNEAPVGQGMVGNVRVVDLSDARRVGLLERGRAGAAFDGLIAVAVTDGEWKRPALWRPGSDPEPIPTDMPGDMVPVAWSPDGETILLRRDFRARNELYLLDLTDGQLTRLATPPGALVQGAECQLLDRNQALVVWSDAAHPSRSILVGADGSSDVLASLTTEFSGPEWQEVTFPSTGGSEIQGWLLTPDAREVPYPTVVYTHGGPTAVHQPVFSRVCQAWVDEGFALLSVNYRGSTTFGEAFRESLTGHVGGPDVDDVVAARDWVVDQGIADPRRVVKCGYSYGGYLTLQALGTHPDLWACGIAGAPVADWLMEQDHLNDVLKAYSSSLFGGTPEELPDLYEVASPITHVPSVAAPLHISQPENDSRTPLPPVQAYVDAMNELGKPVDFHLMAGGHGGSGAESEIEMFERWLAFAREHAG